VAFGAYNRRVNFLDPASGDEVLPPYQTNDIIKGSVTVDPDGYPLLYTGSRDNQFHIVAIDGSTPRAVWQLASDTDGPTLWNNDWDGSALVVDDHLFVGGENGRFYIVRLNRGYDDLGLVQVFPEVVFSTESWDDELLASIRDQEVSVENSVAISGDTVYFANSGGLVQGWDISNLRAGRVPTRVFRFWTGDDTDATVVVDDEGMLYVGSEYQRLNDRSAEIGQIMKLDPSNPVAPLVWSRQAQSGPETGIWATPALHGDVVIVPTDTGEVLGLDRSTGDERWRLDLPGPLWSSPVVVDDTLVQGDCAGNLHAFTLDPTGDSPPTALWSVELGGCIESTPAVWNGQILVGSRNGKFYAIGD
jgi:outer membrane protein assembly factor BamB